MSWGEAFCFHENVANLLASQYACGPTHFHLSYLNDAYVRLCMCTCLVLFSSLRHCLWFSIEKSSSVFNPHWSGFQWNNFISDRHISDVKKCHAFSFFRLMFAEHKSNVFVCFFCWFILQVMICGMFVHLAFNQNLWCAIFSHRIPMIFELKEDEKEE